MRWKIIIASTLWLTACDGGVTFQTGGKVGQDGAFGSEGPLRYQPPVVSFSEVPLDLIIGEDAEATFEVVAGDGAIAQVICSVDGVEVACSENGGTIVIDNPSLGYHEVVVVVEDENGFRDEVEASFGVFDQMRRETQEVLVDAARNAQTDILFVIDNSASMEEEQQNMASRILSFMEKLAGLDWRIAIVTTDTENSTYGDGRLIQFKNRSYHLDSTLGIAEAKKQFADAIQREETGYHYERGIYSVYRAIERLSRRESAPSKFFREEAALSVILVSDEDETKIDENSGRNLPALEKSDDDNLISLVRTTWGREKLFQFNAIINRPGDDQCLGPNGNGYAYGKFYEELSKKTKGTVGDICAADYGNQLTTIGRGVAILPRIFNLNCQPQDLNRDGLPDVTVEAAKGQQVPPFTVAGLQITFAQPLQPGEYKFVYLCFAGVSP